MRLILALLAVLLVPAMAVAVGMSPYLNQGGLSNPVQIAGIMTECVLSQGGVCRGLEYHNWLGLGGLLVGGVGLALVLFIAVSGIVAGRSRDMLANTFSKVTFVSLLVMSVIMTLQGLLLVGAIIVGTGTVIFYVVIIGLMMTAFIAYASVTSLFGMFQKAKSSIVGVRLESGKGAGIRKRVQEIADQLEMKAPENIIVGLEPSFFATSGGVSTPYDREELSGETLYLSLPLMRVLSVDETSSIIGHELGHFSGQDTAYTKRFAPAYMGLYQAQATLMEQENGWLKVAALPSRAIINFLLATFQPAERRIGREREFRADQIGASVGSAQGLSNSLVKLAALSQIWNIELNDLVARVQHGRISRNLSRNFVDRGRYDIDFDSMHEYTKESLKSEIAHPTDTHPQTSARIEALGIETAPLVDPENFKASLFPEQTLCDLCSDIQDLEESVSGVFQDHVSRMVPVDTSEEMRAYNNYSEFLSMSLAKMVTIDGHVDDEEMFVAQKQAYEYDDAFDGTSFREHCRHPEDIPDVKDLIAYGNKVLNTQGATKLNKILLDIANADGVIDPDEQALLDRFAADLTGVSRPDAQAAQKAADANEPPKRGGWGD